MHRRHFFESSLAGLSALCLPPVYSASSYAAQFGKRTSQLKVTDIRRRTVRLPYRDAPRRAMDRELPHWRYAEVFEVELSGGAVGIGEGLLYYTWHATRDEYVRKAIGKNAAEIMWDDYHLGAGLQMALFDAVARTARVPVHRLLGSQLNDKTPLSWWNIDMATPDMLSECQLAHKSGYMAYKTKGRPWFDLWDQVETVVKHVPPEFKVDMDFNDTLLNSQRGIPILKELDKYPQLDIYETPIPQGDIPGNRAICQAVRGAVAMHYGTPSPAEAIRHQVCDGFVIGGGAARVMRQGSVAREVDLPFWLQLVGTGITAAWSLHFGAVHSHATWPAVNCHQLYAHDLLKKKIPVHKGFSPVPGEEGIGYEPDWQAIEKYQVDKPAGRPDPARMLETRWPDGRVMYTPNNGQVNFMLTPARKGTVPYFEKGVTTRLLPNDGSEKWKAMYEQGQQGPVLITP